MARRSRSALAAIYTLVIGAGLVGGIAAASGPPCNSCNPVDVSTCTPTGSYENWNCCMPVNGGGKDCFSCQRQEYLCGTLRLGPPVNPVDSGIACN